MTTTTASLATTLEDLGAVFVEGLAVFALVLVFLWVVAAIFSNR